MDDYNPKNTPDILIVDDTPMNLKVLGDMLMSAGYAVRFAPNGELALRAAELEPPDLVLLDINMPGLNGYEVCERLKANETLRDIPVIFISALHETAEKVKAFDVGGVDYVTKPFHTQEVLARVKTQLRQIYLQRELQDQNLQLTKLEQLKNDLTNMIVHDLRSPLTGLIGNLSMLQDGPESEMDESTEEMIGQASDCASLLSEMVTTLLDVSRLETNKMPLSIESADIRELAKAAVDSLGALSQSHRLNVESAKQGIRAACDRKVTQRVIANLVGNAVRYAPEKTDIDITIEPKEDMVAIRISDCGPGIPEEYRERIFEKFGQIEARTRGEARPSSGLGLAFCKLAVEAQDGSIGVDSEAGAGSVFWFMLPAA